MFDIAPSELLLVALVALVVIGPKDLPRVMRTIGHWVGQARGMARHFRAGVDEMIRQSEIEEMEKKWAEENARIMREHPMLPAAASPPDMPAEAATVTPRAAVMAASVEDSAPIVPGAAPEAPPPPVADAVPVPAPAPIPPPDDAADAGESAPTQGRRIRRGRDVGRDGAVRAPARGGDADIGRAHDGASPAPTREGELPFDKPL